MGQYPVPTSTVCLTLKMYFAGIMDHFSDAPKMELIVWGSTLAIRAWGASGFRSQIKNARSTAGDIKPGSTGPRIWTTLALFGQFCGSLPPSLVYLIVTAYNGFRQPQWMAEYALPSPPDVFGVDGITVGRAAGILVHLAGTSLARAALKTLGDQYHAIGVSPYLLVDYRPTAYTLGLQIREKPRLVDHGPFAYVRHPIYTQVSYPLFTVCGTVTLTTPHTAEASLPRPLSLLRSGRTFPSAPFPSRSVGAY